MTDLVVATRNAHKVREIQSILGPGLLCIPLSEVPGAPALIEDGDTFAANASMKAIQLVKWLALQRGANPAATNPEKFVLADDSGLEVDALDGAPGVHSARFAALDTGEPGNSPDAENNAKLLRMLADVPLEKRTGRFVCVLALVGLAHGIANVRPELFEGTCEGRIGFAPRSAGGFGYDPLFLPNGHEQSFAELGEDIKNRLSHRARALTRLRRRLAPDQPPAPS